MSLVWVVGYLSTSLGFSIGGIIAWLLRGVQRRIDTIYSICAGLILGLLSFELSPEAIDLGSWITFIAGFMAGVILFKVIHRASNILLPKKVQDNHLSLRTGILLMLSITFHNLPIGIVLGANQSSALNQSLLQTLLLHNIPEGIIVFTPLFMAGLGIWTWFLISLIVASPVGIGAYFGSSFGIGNPMMWSFSVSLAVGTIYMVTVKEILMESIKDSSSSRVFLLALFGFAGIGWYFLLI